MEVLATQSEQLKQQELLIAKLSSRITELEARLNRNSRNSHKPPSSDGYGKPALPKDKISKVGGQPKHKGDTLKKLDNPDFAEILRPSHCAHCDSALPTSCETEFYDSRQVFDLPPVELICKEFQRVVCTCKCGGRTIANYPEGVNANTQYGSRVRALITFLHQEACMPVRKIQDTCSALFGVTINEGTILQIQQMAYVSLEDEERWISNQLNISEVVHADESGLRVEGKLKWLHTLGNDKYTLQFVHEKRGIAAHLDTISFLPEYKNWLIHDCWASYFSLENCRHGICQAHILRELTSLIEQDTKWAKSLHDFLLKLYIETDKGTSMIPIEKWKSIQKAYEKILNMAKKEEPLNIETGKAGRTKQSKGRNLLNRLIEYKEGILAFAKNHIVPFTNNLAERDIRPCKSKIKIAGTFRATSGAEACARIRSFISTAKKHQSNAFNELVRVFEGKEPLYRAENT